MKTRRLGKTGVDVTEIGFGAWAIGGAWGPTDDESALDALRRSCDLGVNFIDTADCYGAGRSEKLIASVLAEKAPTAPMYVATKAGRLPNPHGPQNYTYENLKEVVNGERERLRQDKLFLLQLHCPPPSVIREGDVFNRLRQLRSEGLIEHFGVSVETVEEAQMAIKDPDVATIQIIFNCFRLKPAETFFNEAAEKNVGIIARVPLASGLLAGRFKADTQFHETDHRNFNAKGEAFDIGETFSGVPYDVGLQAVDRLRGVFKLSDAGPSMAQHALRWILEFPAVSTVIPGARNRAQIEQNVRSCDVRLPDGAMDGVRAVYDELVRPHVHQRW